MTRVSCHNVAVALGYYSTPTYIMLNNRIMSTVMWVVSTMMI